MTAAYHKEVHFEFSGDSEAARARIPRARVLTGMAFEMDALGLGYLHRSFHDSDGTVYDVHIVRGLPPAVHITVPEEEAEPLEPSQSERMRLLWLPEGFFLTPKRKSDARWGWGAPRRQGDGTRINPPHGTPYNGDSESGALKQVMVNRYRDNNYIDSLAKSLANEVPEIGRVGHVGSAAINFHDYEIIGWYRDEGGSEQPMIRQFLFNDADDADDASYYYRFQPVFYEQEQESWFCHWPEEIYNPGTFEEYSFQAVNQVRFEANQEPLTRPIRGQNYDIADKILDLMVDAQFLGHDHPLYAEEYRYFGQRIRAAGHPGAAGENLYVQTLALQRDLGTTQAQAEAATAWFRQSPEHYANMVSPWVAPDERRSGSLMVGTERGIHRAGGDGAPATIEAVEEGTPRSAMFVANMFLAQKYFAQPSTPTQKQTGRDVGLDAGNALAFISGTDYRVLNNDQSTPVYEHILLEDFDKNIVAYNRVFRTNHPVLGAGLRRDAATNKLWLMWVSLEGNEFVLQGAPFGVRYSNATSMDAASVTTFARHAPAEDATSATHALFSSSGERCVIQYAYKLGTVDNWIQFSQVNFNLDSPPSDGVPLGYEGLRIVEMTAGGASSVVADNTPMIHVEAGRDWLGPSGYGKDSWRNYYSAHCSDSITVYPAYDGEDLVTCSIQIELHYDTYGTYNFYPGLDYVPWSQNEIDYPHPGFDEEMTVTDMRTLVFPDGTEHVFKKYTQNTDKERWFRDFGYYNPIQLLLPGPSFEDTLTYIDPLRPEDTSFVRVHYKAKKVKEYNTITFLAQWIFTGIHEVYLQNSLVYTSEEEHRLTGQIPGTKFYVWGPSVGSGLMLFAGAFGFLSRAPSGSGAPPTREFSFSPRWAHTTTYWEAPNDFPRPDFYHGFSKEVTKFVGDSPRQDYGFSFTQSSKSSGSDVPYWRSTPVLPLPSSYYVPGGVAHNVRASVTRYKGERIAALETKHVWAHPGPVYERETDTIVDSTIIGVDFTGLDFWHEGDVVRSEPSDEGRFFVDSSLDLEDLTGVQNLSPDIWPFGRI